MGRLRYLLHLTPWESWRLLRRRLPGLRGGPCWTANELLSSAKHSRGVRFAELLLRQEGVIRQHREWDGLDFEGRRVIEVGCGPLAGYGPLAIFCGAAHFESADPEWDEGLFFDDSVVEGYLRVFHADLVGLYGRRMDFAEFRRALTERMHVHRCGFESAPIQGSADIVLSQSCLEHLFAIERTIEKLAAIQTAQTRFIHLVDFGNHYPTINPFESLYEQLPAKYITRRGKEINLLRVTDILELFLKFGLVAEAVCARVVVEGYNGQIHPWWRERYDQNSLFTQHALVINRF